VSAQGKDLIQGLLTTDPERRLRLRDIKNHPWFTQTCEASVKSIIGIKVGHQSIPVDPAVLAQMVDFNENVDETRKYIENNRHNHSITIYYLLLKKQLRAGTESEYDICSGNFNPQLLTKKAEPPKEKEKSESTNTNDLEEIQLDSMTSAMAVVPRSNRIISRLSHLRDKEGRKR
jgi:serine/threonine protein kinase